ncbi:hypothetical protein NL676_011212 [Syzygium grande]|nr:hypothetical protein NL676_011212 [Syzygium grande]
MSFLCYYVLLWIGAGSCTVDDRELQLHLRERPKELGYRDTDLNLAAGVGLYRRPDSRRQTVVHCKRRKYVQALTPNCRTDEDDCLCLVDKQIAFAVIFSMARIVGGPYPAFSTLSAVNYRKKRLSSSAQALTTFIVFIAFPVKRTSTKVRRPCPTTLAWSSLCLKLEHLATPIAYPPANTGAEQLKRIQHDIPLGNVWRVLLPL